MHNLFIFLHTLLFSITSYSFYQLYEHSFLIDIQTPETKEQLNTLAQQFLKGERDVHLSVYPWKLKMRYVVPSYLAQTCILNHFYFVFDSRSQAKLKKDNSPKQTRTGSCILSTSKVARLDEQNEVPFLDTKFRWNTVKSVLSSCALVACLFNGQRK